MNVFQKNSSKLATAAHVLSLLALTHCTSQSPGSFRLEQQEEAFSGMQQVNTRLDILWVIDNSGSMAGEQAKLRDGFVDFANRYMQPTWDIRLAVITTDTYLAHPALQNYLNSPVSYTSSFTSNYVNGITSGGVTGRVNSINNPNPAWASGLFVWDSGSSRWRTKSAGLTSKEMRPNLGRNWAKLLNNDPATGKGNHDGPSVALCFERSAEGGGNPLSSDSECEKRDNISRSSPVVNTGTAQCISPGAGEAAVSQCVNTGLNDTVHSGKSIITTFGVNSNQLINDFLVNATVGIDGHGTEAGINSMLQLLDDNEASSSTTKFFRPDSLRVIIFVSDEEDVSVVYPTNGTQVNPRHYLTSGSPCQKTVDGYTYTISQCINPSLTYPAVGSGIPVSAVKSRLDQFFRNLDRNPSGDPNYFITTITALTKASVQQSGDQGTRYLQLGQAVGNGSLALEINSTDYSPLLDSIGQVVVQKKGVFVLNREATGEEDMIVKVRHANGSEDVIPSSDYTVSGKTLTITNQDLVLSFTSTDLIVVSYQPRSIN